MFAYSKLVCRLVFLGLVGLLMSACATTIDSAPLVRLDRTVRWVVLPFSNGTETPLAGQRAEAVALGLVQTLGVNDIQRYPQNMQEEKLFEFGQGQGYTQEQALMWARAQQARFALAGSVQEWRYKVGVDGEPVVGVSLRIVDLADGRVIWSAVGAKSGGSRESLAAAGQKLMKSMLEPVFSKN